MYAVISPYMYICICCHSITWRYIMLLFHHTTIYYAVIPPYDNDGWSPADEDLGRLKVSSCMPVGGCRLGLRMIGRLLALSASSVSPEGPSHSGGDSRYGGKRRRQASAQAERQMHATNVRTRTLATHAHQFSMRCSIHGASLETLEQNRQNGFIRRVFRWRRSFGVVLLLLLMLKYWRVMNRPANEEERLALKHRPRWDRSFLMFRSDARIAALLLLLWLINTKRWA